MEVYHAYNIREAIEVFRQGDETGFGWRLGIKAICPDCVRRMYHEGSLGKREGRIKARRAKAPRA
jgi:hypothetical protein